MIIFKIIKIILVILLTVFTSIWMYDKTFRKRAFPDESITKTDYMFGPRWRFNAVISSISIFSFVIAAESIFKYIIKNGLLYKDIQSIIAAVAFIIWIFLIIISSQQINKNYEKRG